HAVDLAPGNVRALRYYGLYAVFMGQIPAGIAAARRAVVLDPLNRDNYGVLGTSLFFGRQYDEAIAVLQRDLTLDPDDSAAYGNRGLSYYALGNYDSARASCEASAEKK